jgi:glycosyltransferase involved in cell wall biosynthesis
VPLRQTVRNPAACYRNNIELLSRALHQGHYVNLSIVFSFGVSLQTWSRVGNLSREVAYYGALVHEGWNLTLVTYGDATDRNLPLPEGVTVIPLYENRPPPTSKIAALLDSFRIGLTSRELFKQADIIRTNQLWGCWVALLCGWRSRRPVLIRCGFEKVLNDWRLGVNKAYCAIEWLLSFFWYRCAKGIIVSAPNIRLFLQRAYGLSGRRITIIPNVVDTQKFSPQDVPCNGRCLYVGRLAPEKNLHLLIKSVQIAKIGLDIIGQGPLRDDLVNFAEQCHADVRFLGMVPNHELPFRLSSAACFALISRYEGNPKALLEAMACGLAVVGSDVAGLRDIVQNGVTGLLVASDAPAISAAIRLVCNDRERARALGCAARTEICQRYSMQQVAACESSLLRAMIGKQS